MEFEDKVVVITGAAGGIGKEAARFFAQAGAIVSLVDINRAELDKVAHDIGLQIERHISIVADVSKEADVKNYVERTVTSFGKIDVFFNNAGIEGTVQPLIDVDADHLSRLLDVNVKGVFFGMKHVIPVMIHQKSGSVINTSSVAGIKVEKNMAHYAATKHAVIGITKSAAKEYAEFNVRINAICPGPIRTRMIQAFEATVIDDPANAQKIIRGIIPMGRYGEAQEVAQLVGFLASPRSSYITGSVYTIDGGVSI